MTALSLAPYRQRSAARGLDLARRIILVLCVGGGIGTIVALGLYVTKPTYVILLPAALVLLLPTVCLKNFRLYWFALFLLSTQFSISKNLNDGLAVIERLKIDYTIDTFTFNIMGTDLIIFVLLVIWANDRLFLRKPLRFPAVTWLAVAYLCTAVLSTVVAESPYLVWVELWRQVRFFVVYLYAVNCLDSKPALRVLAIVGVVILVTQGAMTVTRFETGYMTPISFGETHQDESQIEQYLAVDRTEEGSAIRAFGTLGSPGSTTRLCMLIIPFALFLSVRNPMFKLPLVFAALTAFGLLALILTFTRVYYITTAVECSLGFLIMIRDRMIKREEVVLIVVVAMASLVAASPKIYEQFTVREDSVSVRFLQYEATEKMILDHPFLGVGFNNGTGQKYKYATETYNQFDPNTQFYLEPTHNLYLGLAADIGIPGMLLFVAFFGQVTLLAWRQSWASPDPEVRWAARAFVLAFCSVAVNSMMDPLDEYPVLMMLWAFAGISLNLPRMAQETQPGKPQRMRVARA